MDAAAFGRLDHLDVFELKVELAADVLDEPPHPLVRLLQVFAIIQSQIEISGESDGKETDRIARPLRLRLIDTSLYQFEYFDPSLRSTHIAGPPAT